MVTLSKAVGSGNGSGTFAHMLTAWLSSRRRKAAAPEGVRESRRQAVLLPAVLRGERRAWSAWRAALQVVLDGARGARVADPHARCLAAAPPRRRESRHAARCRGDLRQRHEFRNDQESLGRRVQAKGCAGLRVDASPLRPARSWGSPDLGYQTARSPETRGADSRGRDVSEHDPQTRSTRCERSIVARSNSTTSRMTRPQPSCCRAFAAGAIE
jgi:hypothetical protein